jgi:hypothetical protein
MTKAQAVDTSTTTEPTTATRPLKAQAELFRELHALRHVADLAARSVENKMMEMAEELGTTFRHEGMCSEHPTASVLQIRVRFSKQKNRDVPFFVPLMDFPKAWLGKSARDARRLMRGQPVAGATEAPILQISEPAASDDILV